MRLSIVFGIALSLAAPGISTANLWAAEAGDALEPPAADSQAAGDVITLFTDKSQRMAVDITINGKGPFPFIIDTGAENTLIARDLADQLALAEGPDKTIHSLGATRTVGTVIIPQLAVNRLIVKDTVAAALSRNNLGAAGILGLPALKSQRMLMDFKAGMMSLTPSDERQENWQGESIVVTARSRLGQLILTDASIDGEFVQIILDTGNDLSVGNLALRRLLSKRGAVRSSAAGPSELLDVNGATTLLDYAIVKELRIASLGFENVPIAFADARVFSVLGLKRAPALLLGMEVLQLFGRVSIDFGRRRVRFQRPEEYEIQ